jgi:hypothetical protein
MSNNVLRLISKLLAVRESRGATEAEASLAAERIQDLLQKHNLTLAQVEAAGGESDGDVRREKRDTGRRAMYNYQRALLAALADNNFCIHRVASSFVPDDSHGRKTTKLINGEHVTGYYEKRHVLVGRAMNVRVTQDTYDYLLQAMRRAADEAGHAGGMRRTKSDFYDGCVSRLTERLAEKVIQAKKESERAARGNGTHKELALSDVYGTEADLNNDFLNSFPRGTTAARRRQDEERKARIDAERNRLVAEGLGQVEAWYRAHGYGEERATELANNWERQQRRARTGRGRSQRWTTGDHDRLRKVNSAEYKAGRSAGGKIGLDSQVGAGSAKKIGRS